MTEPLNKLGVQQGLAALADITKAVTTEERRAEQRAAEAEAHLIAMRKLRGFVTLEIESFRARLRAIEDTEKGGDTS